MGERLRLIEAKLSDTSDTRPRGFAELSRALPPGGVLSRTVITPRRGQRNTEGNTVTISDWVDLGFLAS